MGSGRACRDRPALDRRHPHGGVHGADPLRLHLVSCRHACAGRSVRRNRDQRQPGFRSNLVCDAAARSGADGRYRVLIQPGRGSYGVPQPGRRGERVGAGGRRRDRGGPPQVLVCLRPGHVVGYRQVLLLRSGRRRLRAVRGQRGGAAQAPRRRRTRRRPDSGGVAWNSGQPAGAALGEHRDPFAVSPGRQLPRCAGQFRGRAKQHRHDRGARAGNPGRRSDRIHQPQRGLRGDHSGCLGLDQEQHRPHPIRGRNRRSDEGRVGRTTRRGPGHRALPGTARGPRGDRHQNVRHRRPHPLAADRFRSTASRRGVVLRLFRH